MVVLWFSVFARWLQMKSISSSESYSPLLVIHKGKKTAVFHPLEATNRDLSSRAKPWKFSADFCNLHVRCKNAVLYNNKIKEHKQ